MRRVVLIIAARLLLERAANPGGLYWFLSGDGIRSALEQQASTWLGQPVGIGGARAQFFPRLAIHLSDVRAGNPAQVTFGSVDVSTDLRALLDRRIEDAEVVISRSRIQLPLTLALPDSGSPAPTANDGSTSRAIQLTSVRTIALRDVQVVSRGREIVVSAESSLNGDRLQLASFTAKSGATSLNASGVVQLAPRIDARLRVTANQLDVDELLSLASAFTPPASAASTATRTRASGGPPPRIAARVSSEKAAAGGIEVRQFATDLEVDGESIALSPLTFQLFGGRYQGSVSARLGSSLSATVRARISDLD